MEKKKGMKEEGEEKAQNTGREFEGKRKEGKKE